MEKKEEEVCLCFYYDFKDERGKQGLIKIIFKDDFDMEAVNKLTEEVLKEFNVKYDSFYLLEPIERYRINQEFINITKCEGTIKLKMNIITKVPSNIERSNQTIENKKEEVCLFFYYDYKDERGKRCLTKTIPKDGFDMEAVYKLAEEVLDEFNVIYDSFYLLEPMERYRIRDQDPLNIIKRDGYFILKMEIKTFSLKIRKKKKRNH